MKTVDAALALLTQIEIIVNQSDVCEIQTFQVTAGEPAAPTGQCSQISVWASQFFNASTSLFNEDNPCVIVKGVQLSYRIDLCYTEQEADRTPAQHLATATCLYDLADAVWCGLNQTVATLFAQPCKDVSVDPMDFQTPQGGIVSAQSGVRFQLDCDPAEPVS